ncbi:MAG: hypothetical protein J5719_00075 [Bacteroidales bacterium]|nr:hypothetical protein [Bacteroidales bacterium]
MTEREFDELWQRAEAESYGQRLASDYPAWRQKRLRMNCIVAAVCVLVATVTVSLLTVQHRQPRNYEKVYCNRAGTTDEQWTSLVEEMLME